MANVLLMQLCFLADILIKDMNYHCAKFYTNASTNMDTTKIFLFLVIFCTEFLLFYPEIANFGLIQLCIIANIVS